VVDLDALEAAGIANAHARADLIEYLDGLGFTADEMVEAERNGRLFGLAGDVLQWSGRPIYSLRTAAEALGVPTEEVAHAWAVVGLTVADPEQPALSQADVDGLATWVAMRAVVGNDAALGWLRVLGAAMARLAEAGSTVIRLGQPDIQMTHTQDELTTARAYRAAAEFIPRLGVLIDAVYRHHTISARAHFERVIRDTSASVTCGVGFADLSGFTALTQRLTPAELSGLLDEFNNTVADVVHTDGGRVVKFIGDEVMWVTSTPERLMKVAIDLVEHPRHGRQACKFMPVSATARCWPSAAITSATRSTWRPVWWRPRRRGRSSPRPMFATSWPNGPRSHWNPCHSRVSNLL
jgi:class 3 adenylate cyclase